MVFKINGKFFEPMKIEWIHIPSFFALSLSLLTSVSPDVGIPSVMNKICLFLSPLPLKSDIASFRASS